MTEEQFLALTETLATRKSLGALCFVVPRIVPRISQFEIVLPADLQIACSCKDSLRIDSSSDRVLVLVYPLPMTFAGRNKPQ